MEKSASRFVFASLLAFCMTFLWVGSGMADGGPHGGFSANTDACAGCHRTHTASSSEGYLLAASDIYTLCIGCHDGTGATTNVVDGISMSGGRGLRGGGFTNTLMDIALTGSATSDPVTSVHSVNGATVTLWGNGAIDSGPGNPNFMLTCGTCHNPHGESSYRLLRPVPTGSGAPADVIVPDQSPKVYTVSSASNRYLGEGYGSLGTSLTSWCVQCHTRYSAGSGSGHTDSGDDIFAFRHNTLVIPCVTCHVGHGTSAVMTGAAGTVEWPDNTSAPSGDARSSLLRVNNRAVCVNCHVTDGEVTGGSCDSCHGAPPVGGAHQAHSSPDVVGYGMVGAYSDAANYRFGCGECHPTDSSAHQNGTVDVDLDPSGAPSGSLKQANSPAAAFDGSACGGVYCHSGAQVTSGPVGNPLIGSDGQYILDSHRNLTYDPYTVNTFRVYATTPAWAGGNVAGACADCHNFPNTTSVPGVSAGIGDGHQWVDDWGYGNLHAYNMSYAPLSCNTCHYGEIIAPNTWSRNSMDITSYNPVSINDRSAHVNGQASVTFTASPVVYGATSISLSGATYNGAEHSCSNVGCHINQTYVVWGTPYRWWTNECDLCHRYGAIPLAPVTGLAKPTFVTGPDVHPAANPSSAVCTECHTRPHGQ